MLRSFNSLKFFVLYLGTALVVIGSIVAILLVRGIVKPVRRLRGILLQLGRGVFPRARIATGNDEIGDMSMALTGLVEVEATMDFPCLGCGRLQGRIPAPEQRGRTGPCAADDAQELSERERVLEEKVRERTEEMVRQKDD